jgi:peptide/nickel transport system substrate-binding protein
MFDGQIFEFLYVKDHTVRVLKLLKGEIDMLQNDLPPELVSLLAKDQRVRVIKGKGSNFTYLGFNMEDPVVGRLGVRKAIAHALNREDMIRYVLGGAARPASALLPPEHWAGNQNLIFYSYNPVKAKNFLNQEGFDEQRLPKITYKTSSDPFRVRLATIIQRQLEKVGFEVDVRSYDWGTFYGDIKGGRFQMFSLTWVGITTPDIFHMIFHSESVPPNGANRGRFQNAVADQLIVQAQRADTRETQMDLYRHLQEVLLDQLPYIPLWYEDHFFAGNKNLEGYQLAPDGNYDGLSRISLNRKNKQ